MEFVGGRQHHRCMQLLVVPDSGVAGKAASLSCGRLQDEYCWEFLIYLPMLSWVRCCWEDDEAVASSGCAAGDK